MVVHKEMFDESNISERPTVMVSGGFDPVHVGHIRMIREAAKYGDVIVIANSDDWLYRKKGFNFMTFSSRHEILDSIKEDDYISTRSNRPRFFLITFCPLAQLVEQMTVNHWVRGSNPRGAAKVKNVV